MISDEFKKELFAQESDVVPILLVTVHDKNGQVAIRISSDPTQRLSTDPLTYGTESRGDLYVYLPFEFILPQDRSDAPPRVDVVFDNIDRIFDPLFESIEGIPMIDLEIVTSLDPNYVERKFTNMILSNVTSSSGKIVATLVRNALDKEPYPAGRITPATFPGLF